MASAGTITGSPTLGSTPTLPAGLAWQLHTDAHLVELNVVAGLSGDYNGNGVVDAADYTIWRDTLGQVGAGLPADGNHNNMIDAGDYTVWTTNFGMSAGSGATSAKQVPEPSALSFAFIAAALIGLLPVFRRR